MSPDARRSAFTPAAFSASSYLSTGLQVFHARAWQVIGSGHFIIVAFHVQRKQCASFWVFFDLLGQKLVQRFGDIYVCRRQCRSGSSRPAFNTVSEPSAPTWHDFRGTGCASGQRQISRSKKKSPPDMEDTFVLLSWTMCPSNGGFAMRYFLTAFARDGKEVTLAQNRVHSRGPLIASLGRTAFFSASVLGLG